MSNSVSVNGTYPTLSCSFKSCKVFIEEYPHDECEMKCVTEECEVEMGEYYKGGLFDPNMLFFLIRHAEQLHLKNGKQIKHISIQPATSDDELDTPEPDVVEVWLMF